MKKTIDLNCQLTGKNLSKKEALFLTIAPDGTLIVDLKKELPGPHVCIGSSRNIVELAVKSPFLQNYLGEHIKIPADFTDKLYVILRKRAIQTLCLANKSGAITYGFAKVMAALDASETEIIFQAQDGAADGRKKTGLNAGVITIFSVFTSQELGKIVGRNKIVHMAILKKLVKNNANMYENIVTEMTRIRDFQEN